MKKYSEIGNKIFNSKCGDKAFIKNKIAIHKEIFKQLFFNLESIDIDNIDNQFWLKKIESQLCNKKAKDKKEVLDAIPENHYQPKALVKQFGSEYWWIINLFIRDYINDTLHFDDIRNDLEANELLLYSFGLNLYIWFNETLCKNLNEYGPYGGKAENKYTRAFRNRNINPTIDTDFIRILKNHFNKIFNTIAVICRFCLYEVKEDKEGWYFVIKSNEGILIDKIKSKEIKLSLTDKLIDFKKYEHDPQKASKHLFAILKDPYTFIDGDINRSKADKYFNSSILKEWRDKFQVIRHNADDTSSRKDENKWFKIYNEMSIEGQRKFQNWMLIMALMIYVWHFSIEENE